MIFHENHAPRFWRYKEQMIELTPKILELFDKNDWKFILNVEWSGFDSTKHFILGALQFRRPQGRLSIFLLQFNTLIYDMRIIKEIRYEDEINFIPQKYEFSPKCTINEMVPNCLGPQNNPNDNFFEPENDNFDLKNYYFVPENENFDSKNDYFLPIFAFYRFAVSDCGTKMVFLRVLSKSKQAQKRNFDINQSGGICKLSDPTNQPITIEWLDQEKQLKEERYLTVDPQNLTDEQQKMKENEENVVYISQNEPGLDWREVTGPRLNVRNLTNQILTMINSTNRNELYHFTVTQLNLETGQCQTFKFTKKFFIENKFVDIVHLKNSDWLIYSFPDCFIFSLDSTDGVKVEDIVGPFSFPAKQNLVPRLVKIISGQPETNPLHDLYTNQWSMDVFKLGSQIFCCPPCPCKPDTNLPFLKHIDQNLWRVSRFKFPKMEPGGLWMPKFLTYPGSQCGVLSLVDYNETCTLKIRQFFLSINESMAMQDLAYKSVYKNFGSLPNYFEFIRKSIPHQLYECHVGPKWVPDGPEVSLCSIMGEIEY